MSDTERLFTIYRHSGTNELLAVGHKYEVGGAIFGPFWLLYKKAPVTLMVFALAFSVGPLMIFGANIFTLAWAAITWVVHAQSHTGLQAIRLKSNGYVRAGYQRGSSHDDAITSFESGA